MQVRKNIKRKYRKGGGRLKLKKEQSVDLKICIDFTIVLMQRKSIANTVGEGEGGMNLRIAWKHIHYHM